VLGFSQNETRVAVSIEMLTVEICETHVQVRENEIGSATIAYHTHSDFAWWYLIISKCHAQAGANQMDRHRRVRDSSDPYWKYVTPLLHVQMCYQRDTTK
jgi:hypothetical protein